MENLNNDKLPVPDNMRTNKTLPRVVAIICATLWLIVLAFGTNALAKKQQQRSAAIDQLLIPGRHYWIAKLSSKDSTNSNDCVAYFSSEFKLSEQQQNKKAKFGDSKNNSAKPSISAQLTIDGKISLDIFAKPAIAKVEFNTDFGSFYKLGQYQAKVSLGQASFLLESKAEQPDSSLSINTRNQNYNHSLLRPTPVYLVAKENQQFSLWLPEKFRSLLSANEQLTNSIAVKTAAVQQEEFDQCRASIESRESQSRKAAIELGRYLGLLNISKNHPVLSELIQQ